MFTTRNTRISVVALAALASLVLTSAALADAPQPPDRQDGLGGAIPTTQSAPVPPDRQDGLGGVNYSTQSVPVAPDRIDRLGGAVIVSSSVPFAPDRVDRLGSQGYNAPRTVSTPTVIIRPVSGGFDWLSAMIGGLLAAGLALAAFAVFQARHRDQAVPS